MSYTYLINGLLIGDDVCTKFSTVWTLAGYVIFAIKVLVPIFLIIMSMIELVKALTNTDGNNPFKKIINKVIAAVATFLVFTIITMVIGMFADNSEWQDCAKCALHPFSDGCSLISFHQESTSENGDYGFVAVHYKEFINGSLSREDSWTYAAKMKTILKDKESIKHFVDLVNPDLKALEEKVYQTDCQSNPVLTGAVWYCYGKPYAIARCDNELSRYKYDESAGYMQMNHSSYLSMNEDEKKVYYSHLKSLMNSGHNDELVKSLSGYLETSAADLEHRYAQLYCEYEKNVSKISEGDSSYYCIDNSGKSIAKIRKQFGDSSTYDPKPYDTAMIYVKSNFSNYIQGKSSTSEQKQLLKHLTTLYEYYEPDNGGYVAWKELAGYFGMQAQTLSKHYFTLKCSLSGWSLRENTQIYACVDKDGITQENFVKKTW